MGEIYENAKNSMKGLTGKLRQTNSYSNSQLLNIHLNKPAGTHWLIIETDHKQAVVKLVKR